MKNELEAVQVLLVVVVTIADDFVHHRVFRRVLKAAIVEGHQYKIQ